VGHAVPDGPGNGGRTSLPRPVGAKPGGDPSDDTGLRSAARLQSVRGYTQGLESREPCPSIPLAPSSPDAFGPLGIPCTGCSRSKWGTQRLWSPVRVGR